MVEIPAVVRNKALAAGASTWLDNLPGLVDELEQEWALVVGPPFEGATEAYVPPASLSDGSSAVVKLLIPRAGDAARNEITALQLADGDGCVRLLRDDVSCGALLLERLGRSLHDVGLPVGQRYEILTAAAARFWRPAPRQMLAAADRLASG